MISPQIVIFIIGYLDYTAVGMLMPLITSHVLELGATPTMTGFVSSMYGGVQLISSPIMGSWSDAYGRKHLLFLSMLGVAVSYLLIGLATVIYLFFITRIVLGIFKHTQTLSRAYLADVTPANDRAKVFGIFRSSSSSGFILGPIIGGHIADFENGFFIVCLVSSTIFLANALLLQIILPNVKAENKAVTSSATFSLTTLKEVNWREFWNFFLLKFVVTFAIILYRSNNTAIMKQTLNLSNKTLGYIVSFQGIVGTVTGFAMGYVTKLYNYKHRKLLLHAICLQCVSFAGLSFAKSLGQVLIFLFLLCICNTVLHERLMVLTIERTKAEQLGAVLGVSQSVTSMARMLGPICAGILLESAFWGPSLVSTACSILAFILLVIFVRETTTSAKKTN